MLKVFFVNKKTDKDRTKTTSPCLLMWGNKKVETGTKNYRSTCYKVLLSLSQTTNYRLFQIERVCRGQFQI